MSNTSEGLECFGGQGYIEDTGIPRFLRDAQVLPIWEVCLPFDSFLFTFKDTFFPIKNEIIQQGFFSQGTSNMMALDLLRALGKNNGESYQAFHEFVLEISKNATSKNENPKIVTAGQVISSALTKLTEFFTEHKSDLSAIEFAGT